MNWFWLVLVLAASCVYSIFVIFIQTRVWCQRCHTPFHVKYGATEGRCPKCNTPWER